jgi:hypothetical protein
MTTIASGSSATITIASGGSVSVASNGGFWTTTETPVGGVARTERHGPTAHARIYGPYALGASLTIINQSVNAFNYVDYELSSPVSSTILVGASQTFTLADRGTVVISNPAGFWQVAVTPAIGQPSTQVYGPGAGNMTFGPYVAGATVVVTNQSGATLVVSSSGSAGSSTIGGVAVGSAGSGIFSGFSLQTGDDFDTLPVRHSGRTPTGRYASSTPHSGIRRLGAGAPAEIYIDPDWAGWHSDSPTPYGVDPMTVAGSVLTITASPNSNASAYYGSMPTTYTGLDSTGQGDGQSKPKLISGCLDTWPSFLVSAAGDFMFFAKFKAPAGVARNWWPSMWTTAIANWPDYGEIDVFEQIKDPSTGAITYGSTMHGSTSDGAGDSFVSIVGKGTRPVPSDTWVTYGVKKQGTTLTFYDDSVSQGTLAVAGSYTSSRVSRLRGAHRLRMEMNVGNFDSQTFSIGDWPKTLNIDWWQCWVPTSVYQPTVAPIVMTPILTTPGGSWAATFPSAVSLYGSTPTTEEYDAWFDNDDAPGQETKAGSTAGILPGGMTIDMTGRTTSGTVPTTRGGRTGILFAGAFAAGGQARQALMLFDVAPAVQATLFSNLSLSAGATISQVIAFTDFHSGSLGPHTYTVTSDQSWPTISYGANNWSVTLGGTVGTAGQVATLTIKATNRNGQVTTVTRTVTAAAAGSTFTEDFNRADEDLNANANWTLMGTAVGKARIVSHIVQCQTTDTNGAAYASPDLGSQRQSASGRVTFAGFLCVQLTDALNYIGVRANASTSVIEVYKKVAGTLTAQCAFAETAATTDTVELDFISNVLTVKKNGTTLTPTSGSLTVTGGPPASTRTGLVVRINGPTTNFCYAYAAAVI